MPRKPHLFERISETERLAIMHFSCRLVFGDTKGEEVWKALEPSLLFKARQIGDSLTPEKNFWKGAWRIHEAE